MNITRFRHLEEKWRNEAGALPPGPERDACLRIADGYASLISISKLIWDSSNEPDEAPGGSETTQDDPTTPQH